MSNLVFPARVRINVSVWANGFSRPYRGDPIIFGIRTFARARNDYHLGPIFSDDHGQVDVSRSTLDLLAKAQLSGGLMDYTSVHDAFSFVEIVHWSAEDVDRAIRARTEIWTSPLDGEVELYGSIAALVERLRRSANHSLEPPRATYGRLRDEWADASRDIAYDYTVQRAAAV